MTEFVPVQTATLPQHEVVQTSTFGSNVEAGELAAFEKGRIQGEMEAMRRLEAENAFAAKQGMMPTDHQLATQNIPKADVVEINRLTWLQRLAFVCGEATNIAFLVLVIYYPDHWRGGYSFNGGDGDFRTQNTFWLCMGLGLFCLANAITNYRVLPINTNPWINRAWYIFLQCCTIVAFCVGAAAWHDASPEHKWWSAAHWCWSLAFAIFALHALYSIIRCLIVRPAAHYENWAEVPRGTVDTPERQRDRLAHEEHLRTLYAPAPEVPLNARLPKANANVDQQVPVAPANAPRWAESPHTHAEDYFLLPRAKWATIGFWAMGAAFLMQIAAEQNLIAGANQIWAQDPNNLDRRPTDESNGEHQILGALALCLLFTLCFMSYVAMPPRTTLVKNGVLTDRDIDRRTSISHNAPTATGPTMV